MLPIIHNFPQVSKRKQLTFFVLFLIIILPVAITFFLKTGKNVYKPLPYIGFRYEKTAGDTVYQSIYDTFPDFELVDQADKNIGAKDLKGKIFIADFIFTTCPNICPIMTGNLKRVQDEYLNDKDFRMVSISVDPEHDNVDSLAKYAKKFDINADKWYLLTGDKKYIYRLMSEKGFLITRPETPLAHSEIVELIDKEGHIRGQYKGTNPMEIDRLVEDIHALQVAYKMNSKK